MKLKHLLQSMMLFGMLFPNHLLNAQTDPVVPFKGSLVFSEYLFPQSGLDTYLEIANVGTEAVLLDNIKLVGFSTGLKITDPWDYSQWFKYSTNQYFFLNIGVPGQYLEPGKTLVVKNMKDDTGRWPVEGVECTDQNPAYRGRIDVQALVDIGIHNSEATWAACGGYDSITTYSDLGREGDTEFPAIYYPGQRMFWLEQHLPNGDSVVIDQVGGTFDNPDGATSSASLGTGWSVAGVENATRNNIIVRKSIIKTGNLDFRNAAGVGADDSEWMVLPIPSLIQRDRDAQWNLGNHGSYVLDGNTLEPEDESVKVDFANKKLTVKWGIRRLDDIMRHLKKKPGVAWYYDYNESQEDSVYLSARTGDKLTIYVCGNELQQATFEIQVEEPTADANIVLPIRHLATYEPGKSGPVVGGGVQYNEIDWPRVTMYPRWPLLPGGQSASDNDTIMGGSFWQGLPYQLRVDSLLKYLEKPTNASWEIVWVDGIARPDLKNGDKLKVTAQNGSVKEYFIKVAPYNFSSNAYLSSITWPDIPVLLKGNFGWKGDTIPNFIPGVNNYTINLPFYIESVPAIVAKPESNNSTVKVIRAVSLEGTTEQRTVTFEVTADDGITINTYTVLFNKEKHSSNIQPYFGEPFFSEFAHQGGGGNFIEIANPGNQPLDMSYYMVAYTGLGNPADVIRGYSGANDWLNRYTKYVPGYKYANAMDWVIDPGKLELDVNVDPIVLPGGVFTYGRVYDDSRYQTVLNSSYCPPGYEWTGPKKSRVMFSWYQGKLKFWDNPWGEEIKGNCAERSYSATGAMFLWKIENDSVRLGLKPPNDPNDFRLIDMFGMSDGSKWNFVGIKSTSHSVFRRLPEINKGNPVLGAAFGNAEGEGLEWYHLSSGDIGAMGYTGNLRYIETSYDIGQHVFAEPTEYKSTVTSLIYKLSPGYSHKETLRGVKTETTVSQLLSAINKEDPNQSLSVKSLNGTVLAMDAIIGLNDTLIVLSADSNNITKYILEVTEAGLSSNAVLTSNLYDISIDYESKSAEENDYAGFGSVSGFEYGTQLTTIVNNITVPPGATMTIIDGEGAYVPFKILNTDTVYVYATAHPDIYFDVVAEDGLTRIKYQLVPITSESDAFVLSEVYDVAQMDNLIKNVPGGIFVDILTSNLITSYGASLRVIDKMGYDKPGSSVISMDDKVVVTSANGLVQRVYHIAMLATRSIPNTTYLAYVLSDAYSVNQIDYIISGPSGSTLLTEFYSHIFPSMGATAVVIDINGNEKTGGDLNDGDMLKVTSVDGKIIVMYELALDLTLVEQLSGGQISIYPNPTTGILNVSGVKEDYRIQVLNVNGAMIRDIRVKNSNEIISLADQPSGLYMIIISSDKQFFGYYKVIRR